MYIVKIKKSIKRAEAFASGCWQLGGDSDC